MTSMVFFLFFLNKYTQFSHIRTSCPINNIHVFHELWEEESVPEDWSNGVIFKLPMKRDLTSCKNLRGTTLTSVVAGVLGRFLIKKIVVGTDAAG